MEILRFARYFLCNLYWGSRENFIWIREKNCFGNREIFSFRFRIVLVWDVRDKIQNTFFRVFSDFRDLWNKILPILMNFNKFGMTENLKIIIFEFWTYLGAERTGERDTTIRNMIRTRKRGDFQNSLSLVIFFSLK